MAAFYGLFKCYLMEAHKKAILRLKNKKPYFFV